MAVVGLVGEALVMTGALQQHSCRYACAKFRLTGCRYVCRPTRQDCGKPYVSAGVENRRVLDWEVCTLMLSVAITLTE